MLFLPPFDCIQRVSWLLLVEYPEKAGHFGFVLYLFMATSKQKTERIRDPIHNMIEFRAEEPLDMAAWEILSLLNFSGFVELSNWGFPNLSIRPPYTPGLLILLGFFITQGGWSKSFSER